MKFHKPYEFILKDILSEIRLLNNVTQMPEAYLQPDYALAISDMVQIYLIWYKNGKNGKTILDRKIYSC